MVLSGLDYSDRQTSHWTKLLICVKAVNKLHSNCNRLMDLTQYTMLDLDREKKKENVTATIVGKSNRKEIALHMVRSAPNVTKKIMWP